MCPVVSAEQNKSSTNPHFSHFHPSGQLQTSFIITRPSDDFNLRGRLLPAAVLLMVPGHTWHDNDVCFNSDVAWANTDRQSLPLDVSASADDVT